MPALVCCLLVLSTIILTADSLTLVFCASYLLLIRYTLTFIACMHLLRTFMSSSLGSVCAYDLPGYSASSKTFQLYSSKELICEMLACYIYFSRLIIPLL
jgi:hypothetical protein